MGGGGGGAVRVAQRHVKRPYLSSIFSSSSSSSSSFFPRILRRGTRYLRSALWATTVVPLFFLRRSLEAFFFFKLIFDLIENGK